MVHYKTAISLQPSSLVDADQANAKVRVRWNIGLNCGEKGMAHCIGWLGLIINRFTPRWDRPIRDGRTTSCRRPVDDRIAQSIHVFQLSALCRHGLLNTYCLHCPRRHDVPTFVYSVTTFNEPNTNEHKRQTTSTMGCFVDSASRSSSTLSTTSSHRSLFTDATKTFIVEIIVCTSICVSLAGKS